MLSLLIKNGINIIILLVTACSVTAAFSAEHTRSANQEKEQVKQMQGIAIIGNKEAPKALYIVPWHKTEHIQDNMISARITGNRIKAVDPESLRFELNLYQLNNKRNNNLSLY